MILGKKQKTSPLGDCLHRYKNTIGGIEDNYIQTTDIRDLIMEVCSLSVCLTLQLPTPKRDGEGTKLRPQGYPWTLREVYVSPFWIHGSRVIWRDL